MEATLTVIEIKAAVRARDGFCCVGCGVIQDEYKRVTGRSLDVHRLVSGSKYRVQGCISLCRSCHKARHKATSKADRKRPPRLKINECRVDFTAEPEWVRDLEIAADALGLSRAAYIRMACNRLMASDKKQSDT